MTTTTTDLFRPTRFEEYIGQDKLKQTLQIHIDGANERYEPLQHVLLYGPPGCGKTTLAQIIADGLDVPFISFIMPVKDTILKRVVRDFEGVVLFDEIHRMPPKQQDTLLPLLEDGYLQHDNGSRTYHGALTIVGATTELEKIVEPLYDRFQIKPPFDPYTDEEMALIVEGMAEKLGVELDHDTCLILGRATGGVPRNAKALVGMARDLGSTDAKEILEASRLTPDGLTEMHLRYLQVLADCGDTAGVDIIATHLGLAKSVIVNMEKLLVKRGLIEYTKQGRTLKGKAYKLIGKKSNFGF